MSTRSRFQVVLALAVLLSLGGVLVATFATQNSGDGGRGGAIAVALSFLILFVSRDVGSRAYTIFTEEAAELAKHVEKLRGSAAVPDENKPVIPDGVLIGALSAKADIEATILKVQNGYLAFASVIGTLAWGFGDVAARYLLAWNGIRDAAQCACPL